MKSVFIPCEYNPFHEGHAWQIEYVRKNTGADCVVSMMSGPFVQRGGPAVYGTYERAKAATEGGSDLVILLPYAFCAQTAQIFADGAVLTAASCGADALAFGTEDPEKAPLMFRAARMLTDGSVRKKISEASQGNTGYARARIEVLSDICGEDMGFLSRPNNILGLEYIRASLKHAPTLELIPLPRKQGLLSASQIRDEMIKTGKGARWLRDYTQALAAFIMLSDDERLRNICEYFDGLIPRLRNALPLLIRDPEAFLSAVNTAAVPSARIRRFLVNMLMGFTREDRNELSARVPGYIRVLGIGEKGGDFLKDLKKDPCIITVTKPADAMKNGFEDPRDRRLFLMDMRAEDLYSLPEGITGNGLRFTPYVKKSEMPIDKGVRADIF